MSIDPVPDPTVSRAPSDRVGLALGLSRAALGVLLLVRPALLPGLLGVRDPSRAGWAMQMLGGREIALGLGSVLAIRAEPVASARTWLAAGLISDSTDSITIAAAAVTGSLERRPAIIVAISAAALAATEAVLLVRKSGRTA